MAAKLSNDDSILTERAAIARMSRLSAMHWVALLLSLTLTFGAWYFTSLQVETQKLNRFERYSNQVLDLIQERLTRYEDALASGVAAVYANGGDMRYEEWKEFTGQFQIETKYPGINGMGIIYRIPRQDAARHMATHQEAQPGFRIYPEHGGDTLYPITYIEPAGENSIALGLDMAHETNRLTATLQARETGLPQITGPIILVQDAQKTPGFLFFMPFYKNGLSDTLAERRENFVGMVYAPFVFRKLIKGVLGKDNRLVHFSLHDGDDVLFSEESEQSDGFTPELSMTRTVNAYGRTWTFDIWEAPEFQAAAGSKEPVMILIGGLVIDALLFSLFVLLAKSNHRALNFADRMTEKAQQRAESLQRSNEDLERFASVASHDLKTPLRGISFLTDCIRDDLAELDKDVDASEVHSNLAALEQQLLHMENLITGILNYSGVRTYDPNPEKVDVCALISTICANSGLTPSQFEITGVRPCFETEAVQLEQVLQNLIENAVKYHPEPEKLRLTVNIREDDDRVTFAVKDNGAGIDPRFHGKVFEMFQRLDNGEKKAGTGIGLAIVQKIVESFGGSIRLDSQPGQGCTFTFDWPRQLELTLPRQEAA